MQFSVLYTVACVAVGQGCFTVGDHKQGFVFFEAFDGF